MMGSTHRLGGVFCCLAGFAYLESQGALLEGVSPVLQLAIMYPYAIWGSTFPDLDHASESIPSRDVVSVSINRVLHLTSDLNPSPSSVLNLFNAKHRSWQTHSDLFLGIVAMLFWALSNYTPSNIVDGVILKLVVLGFLLGLVSHLVLDMMTRDHIWFLLGILINRLFKTHLPEKIGIVPRTKLFSTGGFWESLVNKLLWLCCICCFIYIVYLLSPYRLDFSFL